MDSLAQNFTITGKIISADSSTSVSYSKVVLFGTDKATTANEFGNFQIKSVAQGDYTLLVSSLGFQRYEQKISVTQNLQTNIILKPTSIQLSEVTVSPQNSISQSQSVTGIDKLMRPINSAQDLLRLVPGLFIAQHAGGGKAEQIFLRGFDCDHGTDFNISIDGMPVNMVSHAHGQGYADFHFVIPETIDRLNVFKGPYTTRFGDFSTSGTGEFFTKRNIESNEVKMEVGMFDTYRGLAMFKLPNEKKIFTNKKEDAYIAGEYVFTNSYFLNKQNFNRFNLFGKYGVQLNEENYFSFTASTFFAKWNASGQIPERAVEQGLITRYGSIDPSEGGQTSRSNFNATLTTTLKNNATLKNQFYFTNYNFNLFSNFTFYLVDSIHGDEINQTDKRNIFGYSTTYKQDYTIGNKSLHFTAGIGTRNDFTHLSLKHAEKRIILNTLRSGRLYQQNTNAYTDFVFDICKHFIINTGVRFDLFYFNYHDDLNDTLSGSKTAARVSPKLNFYFPVNDRLQFFLKSGIGFHSNDARSVVINQVQNSLPRAYGAEFGTECKPAKRFIANIAFWYLYLQSELVYIGDEGTVETNTPTQRFGVDVSLRYQIVDKLFADIDFNYNHGRLIGLPEGVNYIPLAPRMTSIGGLTWKSEKGVNASLRYRYIDSRPANEDNSIMAKGYFLLDAALGYNFKKIQFGLTVENLLNTKWNQAQFDTETRLLNEQQSVSQLCFTPGTPFFLKGNVAVMF